VAGSTNGHQWLRSRERHTTAQLWRVMVGPAEKKD
jgi:hypothetical protein